MLRTIFVADPFDIVMNEYNNIALLRNEASPSTGDLAIVKGYYAPNDQGGGTYVFDSSSTLEPNMGTAIPPKNRWDPMEDPPLQPGRWLLLHNGEVTTRQFGAIGERVGDPLVLNDVHGSGKTFVSAAEILYVYNSYGGSPFSDLSVTTDTVDWATTQIAILSCCRPVLGDQDDEAETLPGLLVPAGVYKCSRPIWIGDDFLVPGNEGDKDGASLGFSMRGLRGNSRQQVDLSAANFWLINDRTNWYCLSVADKSDETEFFLVYKLSDENDEIVTGITTALTVNSTATEVIDALNTALGSSYSVQLQLPATGTDTLSAKNIYFSLVTDDMVPEKLSPKFRGEILAYETYDPGNKIFVFSTWAHCFPDCAIMSFRRSAGVNYRIANVNLRGNNDTVEENMLRYASFGILFPTTQYFGHIVDRAEISFADTAIGLLQGSGENGEQTRIDRLHAEETRRMLYTNAPQAFSQEYLGWNCVLKNIYEEVEEVEQRDLTDLVFAEFDEAAVPGFGANFYNASGTFSDNAHPETDGTVVRARRGTGTVQFVGGRFEHTARLFNYDAISGQGINNNMDVVFRGVEFSIVGGGDRKLVEGERFEDVTIADNTGTQYGLFVDTCTFDTYRSDMNPEYGDLVFESLPFDKIRCVFQNSRFLGVRSLQQRTIAVAFRQCYKTDFIAAGANDSPLRQFSDEPSTPGVQTQNLRNAWQDTPWIQTGPRVNVLKNSDLQDQTPGTNVGCDAASWGCDQVSTPGTANLAAFGKWGQTGISNLGNISPGPESFGVALSDDTVLSNTIDFIDLETTDTVVLTYQCLCRVKGKLSFTLGNSGSVTIYDEATVGPAQDPAEFTPPTLVTLRLQRRTDDETGFPTLRITNTSGAEASLQVFWQHAWAGGGASSFPLEDGLRNFAHMRTPTDEETENTYVWGVNATSIRAAQRFQLPLKHEDFGWLAATPTGMDISDGEMYFDSVQIGIVVRFDTEWYMVQQPERVRTVSDNLTTNWVKGFEKNVVSTGTGSIGAHTVAIGSTDILPGTVVRVFRKKVTAPSLPVTVTASSVTYSISEDRMAEFVFDGSTWLCTQFNVTIK